MSATASSLDDAKSIEKASKKIVATRNRVSQCRNRITGSKTSSSGSPSVRSIKCLTFELLRGGRRGRSDHARGYSRDPVAPAPNLINRAPALVHRSGRVSEDRGGRVV